MSTAPDNGPASVRLDVWLWSVRIFKTRSEATTACRAGHVRLNGAPVKAAQALRVGDTVTVRRPGWQQEIVVRRLLLKRVGAPVDLSTQIQSWMILEAAARLERSLR